MPFYFVFSINSMRLKIMEMYQSQKVMRNIVYYNVLHIGTPLIVYNNYYGTTSPCNRNKAQLAEILLK